MTEQVKAEYFQRKNNTLVFKTEDNKNIFLKMPYQKVKLNLNKGETYMLENTNGNITINQWIKNK